MSNLMELKKMTKKDRAKICENMFLINDFWLRRDDKIVEAIDEIIAILIKEKEKIERLYNEYR